jgi:two-component system OmpR family response regulator
MSSIDDRVEGFEAGGDDYLVKPFAFTELRARVQALVRRPLAAQLEAVLQVGDLEMDLIRRQVVRAGQDIDLQPLEFRILEYFLRNKGRVVTRNMLLDRVWNFHFDPNTKVVEANISRLRNKIDRPFARPLLHTIRGAGYVLDESAP